jgi:hypothetical protein
MANYSTSNIKTEKDLELFLSLNPFVENIIRNETGELDISKEDLVSKIFDSDIFNNDTQDEADPASGRPCLKKTLQKIKNGNFSRKKI